MSSNEDIREALRTLEIDEVASKENVKQAWRDLLQVWHPDRFAHSDKLRAKAHRKTQTINAAYDLLRNRPVARPKKERPATPPRRPEQARETGRDNWEGRKQRGEHTKNRREDGGANSQNSAEDSPKNDDAARSEEKITAGILVAFVVLAVFLIMCMVFAIAEKKEPPPLGARTNAEDERNRKEAQEADQRMKLEAEAQLMAAKARARRLGKKVAKISATAKAESGVGRVAAPLSETAKKKEESALEIVNSLVFTKPSQAKSASPTGKYATAPASVKLGGIIGGRRPIAMITGGVRYHAATKGETVNVAMEGGQIQSIEIVDILSDAVIIKIEGQEARMTINAPIVEPTRSKEKTYKFFSIKAISGSKARPIVMLSTKVNNYNIMQGDKLDIKTPDGKMTIKCLSIKDRIVELQVGGDDTETIKIYAP
jgi:hypothetical protein